MKRWRIEIIAFRYRVTHMSGERSPPPRTEQPKTDTELDRVKDAHFITGVPTVLEIGKTAKKVPSIDAPYKNSKAHPLWPQGHLKGNFYAKVSLLGCSIKDLLNRLFGRR